MNMKALKRWLPLVVIVVLIGATWKSGIMESLSLDAIQSQREHLLGMVAAHPLLSVAGFVGLYALAVALSLPISLMLTLIGGFLFGRWLGTAAIVVGATTGATIIFLIARSTLGDTLRSKAGSLYNKVAANMDRNAVGYMLFMRLVPLFPFFLVNIIPALFNVRLLPYVATTFIGIIPGTFVYANLGRELGTISSLSDLASPQTLVAFTLLGLFALIPTLYKQIKDRKKVAMVVLVSMLAFSPSAYADDSYDRFLSLYDGLLQSHISPSTKGGIAYNGVNYDDWAKDARHGDALKILLAQSPALYAGNEKKAFWINTYNFLTIELIVREGEHDSIKNLGGTFSSPWKEYTWTLGGQDYTLDAIEHKILRPMGDARVHFAINCASVSCPDLRVESYRVETLNAQLDEQVKLALENQGKGMRLEQGSLYVSKIFDWFSDDFNKGNVTEWLKNYVPVKESSSLQYLPYDWSLNKAENP